MQKNTHLPNIKVYFTDFWTELNPHDNLFLSIIEKYAHVTVDKDNPDILFHSCLGFEHMNYDCSKVCFLGENITPDFNVTDYGIGFDHITFEDRYLRFPLYRFYMANDAYEAHDKDFFQAELAAKTGFCNFIYSNGRNCASERDAFYYALSQYKKVDSGGGHLNNIGGRVGDKFTWQRKYKFSIAFENSSKSGYTTEKLYEALRAHTVPIYWGNPRVAEDFNPKRFINCHDYASFDAVIERVRHLDTHPEEYLAMLMEPWFSEGAPPPLQDDPSLNAFLQNIVQQPLEKIRRTTKNGYTYDYIHRQVFFYKLAKGINVFAKMGSFVRQMSVCVKDKILRR